MRLLALQFIRLLVICAAGCVLWAQAFPDLDNQVAEIKVTELFPGGQFAEGDRPKHFAVPDDPQNLARVGPAQGRSGLEFARRRRTGPERGGKRHDLNHGIACWRDAAPSGSAGDTGGQWGGVCGWQPGRECCRGAGRYATRRHGSRRFLKPNPAPSAQGRGRT